MDIYWLRLVINHYQGEFESIFSVMYPSKESRGFTERNQTCAFVEAYKQVFGRSVVAWYEYPFGEKEHFDGVLVDSNSRRILIIESKRLANGQVPLKKQSINNDINRINSVQADDLRRIGHFNEYEVYGVILADFWKEGKRQDVGTQSVFNDLATTGGISGVNFKEKPVWYGFPEFQTPENWTHDTRDENAKSIRNTYNQIVYCWKVRTMPL